MLLSSLVSSGVFRIVVVDNKKKLWWRAFVTWEEFLGAFKAKPIFTMLLESFCRKSSEREVFRSGNRSGGWGG